MSRISILNCQITLNTDRHCTSISPKFARRVVAARTLIIDSILSLVVSTLTGSEVGRDDLSLDVVVLLLW